MCSRLLQKRLGAIVLLWAQIFLLLLCVGEPRASDAVDNKDVGEIGWATYYAKRFAGRRTASGEIYDHEKLTAAHSRLPFGSRVRVVNLANSREVIVTVNDRCRSRKHPFIDLSRSAAREIGLLGKGSGRVRIIPETSVPPEPVSAQDPAQVADSVPVPVSEPPPTEASGTND